MPNTEILQLPDDFVTAPIWSAPISEMVTGALDTQAMARVRELAAKYPDGVVLEIPDNTSWAVSSSGVISPGAGVAAHSTRVGAFLRTSDAYTVDADTPGFEASGSGLYLYAVIGADSWQTGEPVFTLSDSATYANGILIASNITTNTTAITAATDARVMPGDALLEFAVKAAVRVATTANGTLATAFAAGQTVDGVTLATGDRILIKDQTSEPENGIYVVNASGAPTRASDLDTDAKIANGVLVYVRDGADNGGQFFYLSNTGEVQIGVSAIYFSPLQSGGGGGSTATGESLVRNVTQTAHGLTAPVVVRYNGTNWVAAQADSAANASPETYLAIDAPDVNTLTLALSGYFDGLSGMTVGTNYLSPTTAGAYTTTVPTTAGQVVQPVFEAISATEIIVFNEPGLILTAPVITNPGTLDLASYNLTAPATGTIAIRDVANTFNGDQTINGSTIITGSTFPILRATRSTSTLGSATNVLDIMGLATGDMVDGFGSALVFVAQDDAAVRNSLARIKAERLGADNSGRLVLEVATLGTFNPVLSIPKERIVGVGTVTVPTAWLHVPASTTSYASLRLPAGVPPTTPNEGDVWNSSVYKALRANVAGITQSLNSTIFTTISTVTIANSTTEGTLLGTLQGDRALPANFWTAGKSIHIKARGIHSSSAAPGNLTFRVYLGTVLMATSVAMTPGSLVSNQMWDVDIILTCRTTGASGTFVAAGAARMVESSGATKVAGMTNTGTVTVNTTTAHSIDLTAQWATSSASNSISQQVADATVKN